MIEEDNGRNVVDIKLESTTIDKPQIENLVKGMIFNTTNSIYYLQIYPTDYLGMSNQ